jgi:hypothetical protein
MRSFGIDKLPGTSNASPVAYKEKLSICVSYVQRPSEFPLRYFLDRQRH